MDQSKWADQTMDFMKNSFETSMGMFVSIQEQWLRMMNSLLDQNLSAQQEARKSFENWLAMARKGQEEYKKMMMDNLEKVREIIPKPGK